MATYTYDDFLKAAQEQGWSEGNGFSTADWRLAQQNADAGMSILNAKKDYVAATTAEARAAANQRAEQIRSQYGEYTGGSNGYGYYINQPSPSSFTEPEKPTFSYDLESDPVYSAYKKQYTREGQRAAQDAMGSAAAATGGIPSSYAATAASQAGDYYAAQLSDKVPELYNQAYNKYLNELSQYNTDRSFKYGQYIDEINSQTADRQEILQNALYGAEYGDYSGLAALGYDVSNIPAEYEKKYNLASLAASMGDNSLLKEYFGINADSTVTNADMMYNLAVQRAALGDYSYLNELLTKYYGRTPTDTSTAGTGSYYTNSASTASDSSSSSSATGSTAEASKQLLSAYKQLLLRQQLRDDLGV